MYFLLMGLGLAFIFGLRAVILQSRTKRELVRSIRDFSSTQLSDKIVLYQSLIIIYRDHKHINTLTRAQYWQAWQIVLACEDQLAILDNCPMTLIDKIKLRVELWQSLHAEASSQAG